MIGKIQNRTLSKLALSGVYVLFSVFISYSKALACVCESIDKKQLELYVSRSDFIVIGKAVTSVHRDEGMRKLPNFSGEGSDVLFEIDSVLKGDIDKGELLFIYQFHGSCTRVFRFGKQYLLFANLIEKIKNSERKKEKLPVEISMPDKDSKPSPPPRFKNGILNMHISKEKERFLNEQSKKHQLVTTSICSSFTVDSQIGERIINMLSN